ncbi:hypothetical protein J7L85_00445 [candidate division WOR-3 bacterium]|nr:hypothetical protein [candidate division WOR-3 bacterium]
MKTKKKLQELNKAQQEADQAQKQVDQAQKAADIMQQMLAQAQQQASGQASGQGQQTGQQGQQTGHPEQSEGSRDSSASPQNDTGGQEQTGHCEKPQATKQSQSSTGSPRSARDDSTDVQGQLTPEQAKQIANELAKQAEAAKKQAEAAKANAQKAKSKADKLAEDLLGKTGSQKAKDKLRQLARIGLQAIKDSQAKVEEVSKTLEAWGLDEGELFREGIPEAMGLLERMRKNKDFLKFAKMLGRLRKIAARKAKSKIKGEGRKVAKIEIGRDIRRAHKKELVALTYPVLRNQALKRWARGELRLYGQKTRQKLGHGPIIVCEDSSGSMSGDKQQWTKAVVLSLASFARIQKRTFGWIMFDYSIQKSNVYPNGQVSAKDMLEIAESRSSGGTNFERPLRKAIEMIQNEGLKKADICLITDGECEVSDDFLSEFLATKKRMEINVFSILCDVGSTSDSSVNQFSDRVEKASRFTADEAEAKIFQNLIRR